MSNLPFSEACERNKGPILEVLKRFVGEGAVVLEIGSGTAQHVVHFAVELPATRWQPSDTGDYLEAARARVSAEAPANVAPVIPLDVSGADWPDGPFDAVFTANTLHFMSEANGERLLTGAARILAPGGWLIAYGPFNYGGAYSSPSNERFDAWLRSSSPDRGVRDFEFVCDVASANGLLFVTDIAMPANNQCLVWCKSTAA